MAGTDCLASTGAESMIVMLIVALLFLSLGVALLIRTSKRARAATATLALVGAVIAGGAFVVGAPAPAFAADSCTAEQAPALAPVDPVVVPPVDPVDPVDPEPAVPPTAGNIADGGVLFYLTHYFSEYTVRGQFTVTVDVVAAASAVAPATIDPATVDLDPTTAGVQHYFSDGKIEATSDPATGLITVAGIAPMYSSFHDSALPGFLLPLEYTVSDSIGTVSNVASITFSYTWEEVFPT